MRLKDLLPRIVFQFLEPWVLPIEMRHNRGRRSADNVLIRTGASRMPNNDIKP